MSKKKLPSIPKIHRRLFKLWSEKVRSVGICEYCGKSGTESILNAHHVVSRYRKDSALKFDVKNGIALCSGICHKFGPDSFHKNPLKTIDWLRLNKSDQYNYLLLHIDDTLDLKDRNVLARIEIELTKGSNNARNTSG